MPPEDMTQRDAGPQHEQAARKRTEAEYRAGWKMAGIGMEVAAQVAGGALLGWAVDALFGTSWGVLTGAIIGLIVGMWTLIKGALKLNKQLDAMGPRKIAKRETPTPEKADEELPDWREEWDEWKESEPDERTGDHP